MGARTVEGDSAQAGDLNTEDPLPIFLKKIYLFIYLFWPVLGLRCYPQAFSSCGEPGLLFVSQAFSSCGEPGLLFVAVRGLLVAVASLVVEHGL